MSSTNQVNNLLQPKYNTTGGKNNWESVDSGGVFMDVLTVEIRNTSKPQEKVRNIADASVNSNNSNAQSNANSEASNTVETKTGESQTEKKEDSDKQRDDASKTAEKTESVASESESDTKPDTRGVLDDIETDQSVLLQVQAMVVGVQDDLTTENIVIETKTDISPEITDNKTQTGSDKIFVGCTETEIGRSAAKEQSLTAGQQHQNYEEVSSQQNVKLEKPVSENLPQNVEVDSEDIAPFITTKQNEEEPGFVVKTDQKISESQEKTAQSKTEKETSPLSDIARPIEKDIDTKRDNLKNFDQDYHKVAVSTQQQNDTGADTSGREHGRHKGFNYSDDMSSVSGSAGSGNTSRDINELLGTQAKADDMKIDSARTVDNVVKSVKTLVQNGNPSMTLRLDPPELGQLNIKISTDPNGITIEIQATNAKTQQMLQQNSSQLRSALENAGVNVNNVDVQFKPDVKNNANAGSDSQDNQQGLFDQNNSSFKGNNQEQTEEFLQNKQDFWSESNSFEESQYQQDINRELSAATVNNWQELAFDTVDVTV